MGCWGFGDLPDTEDTARGGHRGMAVRGGAITKNLDDRYIDAQYIDGRYIAQTRPLTGSSMLEIQSLPRSINELLILAAVGGGAMHGYQIALEIEEGSGGFFTFNHGTLYPILHELEKEGLIDGNWDEGRGRQRRKTYALTPVGRAHLGDRYRDWGEFHQRLTHFVDARETVRALPAPSKRGTRAP